MLRVVMGLSKPISVYLFRTPPKRTAFANSSPQSERRKLTGDALLECVQKVSDNITLFGSVAFNDRPVKDLFWIEGDDITHLV